MTDYGDVNRANWDERVPAHVASEYYALERFATDPSFLSDVVRFDLPRLGDVHGLRGVHLQCHIGTDTVSLARLGASMTGLDFSAPAVSAGRALADSAGVSATFVHADVYAAADVLPHDGFDLVYTGIGALCWLPRIRPWAQVVAGLLRPGGRLFIREGHPMLMSLEENRSDDLLVVNEPYFERSEPVVWNGGGTYVQTDAIFEHNTSVTWNHGLGETVTALLETGMRLTGLTEHDSVPWDAMPGLMERIGPNEWRLADRPWRLAHSYTLQAVKPG